MYFFNVEYVPCCAYFNVFDFSFLSTDDFYPDLFTYKTLFINDEPSENLIPHMYEVLDVRIYITIF
jgi:hypothetical protein